jgi:hypothetical protein
VVADQPYRQRYASLRELFAGREVKVSQQVFTFRYESSEHWIEVFKTYIAVIGLARRLVSVASQLSMS